MTYTILPPTRARAPLGTPRLTSCLADARADVLVAPNVSAYTKYGTLLLREVDEGQALLFYNTNTARLIRTPKFSAFPCTWFGRFFTGGDYGITSLGSVTGSSQRLQLDRSAGSFRAIAVGSATITDSFTLPTNRWVTVAYVVASATDRRLYLDGALVSSSTTSVTFSESWTTLCIAATAISASPTGSSGSCLSGSILTSVWLPFAVPHARALSITKNVWSAFDAEYEPAYVSVSSSGTTFTYTSTGGITFSGAATTSFDSPAEFIALTDVADGRIVQRSGTTGSLTIAGTYTGSPTSIQARVVQDGTSTEVVTWTTIVASPAGGASADPFSGTLTGIPQGGWYNVQVRYSNDGAVYSNGSHKFGVGALYAYIGQSNAVGAFTRSSSPPTPHTLTRMYGNDISATGWDTVTGNGAITFANAMRSAQGIPIGVVNYAHSGIALYTFWLDTSPGSYYDIFIDAIDALEGKLEAVLWVGGESDAWASVSETSHYNDMGTLFGRIRSHFAQASLPILIVPLSKYTGVDATDDEWQECRNAQIRASVDSNNYLAATTYDCAKDDGLHYNPAGQATLNTRASLRMQEVLGLTTNSRGPYITAATKVDSTHVDVIVSLRGGTTITPASSITGFRVLDGGTPVTISSAARQSATSVRLTLSSALVGTATVQYMWGNDPTTTGTVYDDSANTLPLEAIHSDGFVANVYSTYTCTSSGGISFSGDASTSLDAASASEYTYSGGGGITFSGSSTTYYSGAPGVTTWYRIPAQSVTMVDL